MLLSIMHLVMAKTIYRQLKWSANVAYCIKIQKGVI